MSEPEFFSPAETQRFIEEIVANSGTEGISEEELLKAYDMLHDWAVGGALLEMWRMGRSSLRWNVDEQDLIISVQ